MNIVNFSYVFALFVYLIVRWVVYLYRSRIKREEKRKKKKEMKEEEKRKQLLQKDVQEIEFNENIDNKE